MITNPTNSFEWIIYLAQHYSSMFLQGTLLTLYIAVTGTLLGFLLGYGAGIVQDIKIYRTCEIEELSESLQKIIKKYDAGIDKTRALYKKNNIPGANTLEPTTAMPPAGKLKNTDGVRIEFYIKYFDNLGIADKVVAQSANKGVVKAVFPKGEEPYSSFGPSKTIHAVFSSRSFNARMVTSPIVSGAINKGLVNLDEQVKKIMGIKPMRLEDIQG